MTRYSIALLAVSLWCAQASAEPVPWNVDPNHSSISFTARHLGFSKVRGEFKKFSAKITADPKNAKLSQLEAEADAKSIDTGNEKRDTHLRSDDFFGADQYPKLKLVLKSIQWKANNFTAIVAVTIRDVTKNVKFEGSVEGPQTINLGQGPHQRAAYHASGKLNRKDFNLKFNGVAEGVALVGDEVTIDLDAEISAPLPVTETAAVPTKQAPASSAKPAPALPVKAQ